MSDKIYIRGILPGGYFEGVATGLTIAEVNTKIKEWERIAAMAKDVFVIHPSFGCKIGDWIEEWQLRYEERVKNGWLECTKGRYDVWYRAEPNNYRIVLIPVAAADDTLYTHYQVELKNMPVEWDTTICPSLKEVLKVLEFVDIHLDDDSETANGGPRQVIITGIGMTRSAYNAWREEHIKD